MRLLCIFVLIAITLGCDGTITGRVVSDSGPDVQDNSSKFFGYQEGGHGPKAKDNEKVIPQPVILPRDA